MALLGGLWTLQGSLTVLPWCSTTRVLFGVRKLMEWPRPNTSANIF